MSILSSANIASRWRGYEYYICKKVKLFTKLSDDEYTGLVSGSRKEPYHVKINTAHLRQSKCDCPYADGKRIICKHMVALFFTAFPAEADAYEKAEKRRREEEEREDELYDEEYEDELYDDEFEDEERYEEVRDYVYSLSKEELRQELINYILDAEDDSGNW